MTAVLAPAAGAATASGTGTDADRSKPGVRIIGGTEVSAGEYPFMVALVTKGKGSAVDRQFCGGTLVDPSVVMTAAHCVEYADAKDIQAVVGRTVLSNNKQGTVRNAAQDGVFVHPRYAKGKNAYDVALVELAKPVKGIAPVKLPTPGTDALIRPGQKATVIGWGNTDTDLPYFPDRMHKVKVPIVSHDECRISYAEYDRNVNFCAGVEGKDSCQGDSGGPIFRTVPGTKTRYQVGIVSYGDGCAAQGAPGVYVSTSSKKLWDTLYDSPRGKELKELFSR